MSKQRRLKRLEMEVRMRANRGEWLPRVAGKTRQQALFDTIEMLKGRLAKPGISEEDRQSYENQIAIITRAWEAI